VSGTYPHIQDVACTACGTVYAACVGESAAELARTHRQAHAAYTITALAVTAAVAMTCWAAASQWPQLEMSPWLAALVGGLAALAGARPLSPIHHEGV